MLKFKKVWTVNGVLTNATSVTIGVLDATTGIQVVPAGTAMPQASDWTQTPITGKYEFPLPAALPEHDYQATIVLVYGDQTYTSIATEYADPPPNLTREPLACDLSRAIAENAAGAQNVSSPAGSVSTHSIGDQILADQYLAAKAAVQSRGGALKRPAAQEDDSPVQHR